LVQNAGW